MKHMMVDIETLATQTDAAILSIGSCMFDMGDGSIGEEFLIAIDLVDCLDKGFKINPETIYWWMSQPREAAEHFLNDRVPIGTALQKFIEFSNSNKAEFVWSNAPQFDLAILRYACGVVKVNFPFHYRNERDMRTLVAVYNGPPVVVGHRVKHNPLDDAIYQAKICASMWQWIRGRQ